MKNYFASLLLLLLVFSCKKDDDGGDNNPKTCPQGYTSANCDQQITPTNVFLKEVTITSFPATDNGAGWDLTSGPDVYLVIRHNSTVIFENQASFKQNATGSVIVPVNLALPSVTDFYSFQVYDYDDFDDDDFMGGVQGPVYTSTNGFPKLVNIQCGGCTISAILSVSYTF